MQLTITSIIVIVTVLVSLGAFNNAKIYEDLIFYPPAVSRRNQWYRFFSAGLIHADGIHLFFNMFSLYMFGPLVEREFALIFGTTGKAMYLLMYVAALFFSLLPTYIKHRTSYHYRSLGASGAVSGVIFAGLLLTPGVEVGLFFIPPFIPGFIFAPLFLGFSIYLDRRGGGNINHSAHIFGAVFGMLFVVVLAKLIADVNVLQSFVQKVEQYLAYKGWM
ncbi:MAG: rhomboid family intramembrane serine protease [Chitinophagaceae bacterium]|nr:rhomboid family intramembrane serine protease [Chitinophagaceae bacterium]